MAGCVLWLLTNVFRYLETVSGRLLCCLWHETRRKSNEIESHVYFSRLSALSSSRDNKSAMSDQRRKTQKPNPATAVLSPFKLSPLALSRSHSRSHSPSADNEWLSGPTTSAPVLIVIYTAAAVPQANYYHSLLNSLSDFLFTYKSVSHISLSLSLSLSASLLLRKCILQRHRYI